MTAVLNEIRRLDERLSRGDLTKAEYMAIREDLFHSIEVVEPETMPSTGARQHSATSESAPRGNNVLGLSIAICFGVMALSVGFILLFLPDLNLALTVGVTVLAALSVALLRSIED